MTEQERAAAALADDVKELADGYALTDGAFAIYFNKAEWTTIEAALRLLAATPAAAPVVTDEMVEAGCTAWANSSGHDYPGDMIKSDIGRAALDAFRKHMRAAIEAALKVKEPTNDH